MVTAQYREAAMAPVPMAVTSMDVMKATEENLGDLKLYRVPERVTVAAKSMKQVAFLDKDGVEGEVEYRITCSPWANGFYPTGMRRVLVTKNDKKHGLGVALPMGGVTLFEPSPAGDLLVGEETLRDYAEGQDVEISLGESPSAFGVCELIPREEEREESHPWQPLRAKLTNANRYPIKARVELGPPSQWKIREKLKGLVVKDGQWVIERTVPANGSLDIEWAMRSSDAETD